MALNLTPDYFEAERKYRQARNPAEQLAALEEMLRTIPKHKASEKKQADLKRRIKELREGGQEHHKKKGAAPDPYYIPPQGGGQAILFGPPNCGKSSILGHMSKAPVKITDFPFGTPTPVPGMALHEDVPIELIDMPPVTPDHFPGPMANAIRNTGVLIIVADLGSLSVLEDTEAMFDLLSERHITFDPPGEDEPEEHAMRVGPQAVIACNKIDLPDATDTFETLLELRPDHPEMFPVSGKTGQGLDVLMARLFDMLNIIRIYAKLPGRPVDKEKPFVLPVGSTVEELARTIHKDIAASLKYARIWGDHGHPGQQVHEHFVLHDKDTVELHA